MEKIQLHQLSWEDKLIFLRRVLNVKKEMVASCEFYFYNGDVKYRLELKILAPTPRTCFGAVGEAGCKLLEDMGVDLSVKLNP